MKTVTIELTPDEFREIAGLVGTAKEMAKVLLLCGVADRGERLQLAAALDRFQSISRKLEATQARRRRPKPTAIVPRNRKTPRASRTR